MPSRPLANLGDDIPATLPAELVQTLVTGSDVRVERILSRGHASPPDFWYYQPEHEWVLLMQGAARLQIETAPGVIETCDLQAGNYLLLPAHQRHRVDWTHPTETTIWLAIFFGGTISSGQSNLSSP
jgi:cupin 2 domain-containing protein